MKKAILLSVLVVGCAAQKNIPSPGGKPEELSVTERFLVEGYKLLADGNRKRALAEFDKAIEQCEKQYGTEKKTVFASRGLTETIYYMGIAAAANEDAITVETACADALYLRGYTSLDSGQLELAEEYIKRAVEMSPVNSKYLSELGHVYHMKLEWEPALKVFLEAEEHAGTFSPPELKERELTRAKRGVGYSLIELGRLDEAEAKFKECLEINSKDKVALQELEYIKGMRGKK